MLFIYYGVPNNSAVLNNSAGWKKTVKLIIVLVGNVPNNSVGGYQQFLL